MRTVPTLSQADEIQALTAFLIKNPDLEKLEALVSRFNIFEALGAVRHELRHSDFLAFLLDPHQSHGLGDRFAKRLLQRALPLAAPGAFDLTPIHVDLMSLTGMNVRREWRNIDILMLDETNRLAVIIENKIDSTEHSNQLCKYWKTVTQDRPGWVVIGLFVTTDGSEPSHAAYIPVSYGVVCDVVDELIQQRASSLHADVCTMMAHYVQMLRRHIVAESDVALLCRKIYQQHRQALDLIFEHRPDQLLTVRDQLVSLIGQTGDLILDSSGKSNVRFLPKQWEDPPLLKQGLGWVSSGRMLLFEFLNVPTRLVLQLYLGPGPESIRHSFFDMAKSAPAPFKTSLKSPSKKWNLLYQREFLNATALADSNEEELTTLIEKAWNTFVSHDLPPLTASVTAHLKQSPLA